MKLFRYLLLVVLFIFCAGSVKSIAQDDDKFVEKVPDNMKYLKDKYEETFSSGFETVWNAILKSLEEKSCQAVKKSPKQGPDGLYKGIIESDYCVFVTGKYTYDTLNTYSLKVPFIRGGDWVNGRVQYKMIVKELKDGTVTVDVRGELSGLEKYVTGEVQFFPSNGYFETMMIEKIKANIAKK